MSSSFIEVSFVEAATTAAAARAMGYLLARDVLQADAELLEVPGVEGLTGQDDQRLYHIGLH